MCDAAKETFFCHFLKSTLGLAHVLWLIQQTHAVHRTWTHQTNATVPDTLTHTVHLHCSPVVAISLHIINLASQTLPTVTNYPSAEWCSVYAWSCQNYIVRWLIQDHECCSMWTGVGWLKALEQETAPMWAQIPGLCNATKQSRFHTWIHLFSLKRRQPVKSALIFGWTRSLHRGTWQLL